MKRKEHNGFKADNPNQSPDLSVAYTENKESRSFSGKTEFWGLKFEQHIVPATVLRSLSIQSSKREALEVTLLSRFTLFSFKSFNYFFA